MRTTDAVEPVIGVNGAGHRSAPLRQEHLYPDRSPDDDIRTSQDRVSRCIDFDSCRYNGQVVRASLREELEPHVDFVPVCPELEIKVAEVA